MGILDALGGGVLKGAAELVGKFVGDPDKAAELNLELKKLVHAEFSEKESTVRTVMQARERVLVAELSQGDTYTKRARPTVVYFGLTVIAFNYCLVPLITLIQGVDIVTFQLPTEFWMAWGGVVATWSIGRSAERVGVKNPIVAAVTGTKPAPTKKDDEIFDWNE